MKESHNKPDAGDGIQPRLIRDVRWCLGQVLDNNAEFCSTFSSGHMEKGMKRSLAFLWFVILVWSCSPAPTFHTTKLNSNDWLKADPQEVGINHLQLNKVVEQIHEGAYKNIHGILIIKDDKLIFEEYFRGYRWDYNGEKFQGELTDFNSDTLHNSASVTKSFTSALIGISIDQGFIRGVDEQVFVYFPEYTHLSDDQKGSITIEDLLTMTSGLEWNGMEVSVATRDPRNDLVQLFMVSDPVEYILSKPLVNEPGTSWYYNGGGTNLLGEIIHRASGMRMDDFAERYLFSPLGIDHYEWDYINADIVHASGNLALRPQDMAKLGYLFLNNGTWRGEQIISKEWVSQSTISQISTPWEDGYGYQWWLRTYYSGTGDIEAYYAAGWGGQRITVFPSLDMVVVFTGGNYLTDEPVDEIIEDFILPAIKESGG